VHVNSYKQANPYHHSNNGKNTLSTLQMEKDGATTGVMHTQEIWHKTGCKRNNQKILKNWERNGAEHIFSRAFGV